MRPPSRWRSGLEATALASLVLFLGHHPATADAAASSSSSSSTSTSTSTSTSSPSSPSSLAAASLSCDNIVADGHRYDLAALAGPHAVVTHEYTRPTYHNTTYAIDVCGPLRRKGDVPAAERCPDGTRVCAIKHRWDPKTDKTETDQVIPIVVGHGDDFKTLTWEAARLPAEDPGQEKDKDKDKDKDGGKNKKREGLRLTLLGATYQQRAQRAVVEFRCDPDLVGTEGEWKSVDEYVPAEGGEKKEGRREEKKKGEDKEKGKDGDDKGDKGDKDESTPERQLKKDGAALVWEGYKREKDKEGGEADTLYLTWYTKHVCDAAVDEPVGESKHWGFFTWLVILVFLAVASYLIFGSWLNYNRYGARGWDLLPHSDTLRDIPYLMKDLVRRALNTLQSTGSRGGYSAV